MRDEAGQRTAMGQAGARRCIFTTIVAAALLMSSATTVGMPISPTSTKAAKVVQPDPEVGDGGVPDFYHWRGAIPSSAGQFLRSEPLPVALGLANAAQSMRFLYTSIDTASGRPVVVSGAIFIPTGTAPQGGWPLMAWAHGTTGMADVCAPSSYPRTDRDSRYLNSWLNAGFAIVATDYQGLGTPGAHPYTNFRAHAYALLDSIRAIPRARLNISGKTILLGQSQGAAAAVAAAGYLDRYAPDLGVIGTVATGVPALSHTDIVTGKASAAVDPIVATADVLMANELHQSDPRIPLDELLTPAGLAFSKAAQNKCFWDMRAEIETQHLDPAGLLKPGVIERLYNHDIDNRAYPTLRLSKPVFIGIGAADVSSIASATLGLVKQMCAAGTRAEAHLYVGQDHNGGVNASAPDAIAFARRLVAGDVIRPVCDPQPQG